MAIQIVWMEVTSRNHAPVSTAVFEVPDPCSDVASGEGLEASLPIFMFAAVLTCYGGIPANEKRHSYFPSPNYIQDTWLYTEIIYARGEKILTREVKLCGPSKDATCGSRS